MKVISKKERDELINLQCEALFLEDYEQAHKIEHILNNSILKEELK